MERESGVKRIFMLFFYFILSYIFYLFIYFVLFVFVFKGGGVGNLTYKLFFWG